MKNIFKKSLLMTLIFCFCYIYISNAATIQATGCSKSALETAISKANDGDVVIVPSGTASWSDRVTVNKDITIQGATTGCPDNCIDNTIITGSSGFNISSGTSRVTISGFTFKGRSKKLQIGTVSEVRIQGNKFDGNSQVMVIGAAGGSSGTSGVFYDNHVLDCSGECIDYNGGGDEQAYIDGGDWEDNTKRIFYFEDNVFELANLANGTNQFEGNGGSRWVVRHNTFKVDSDSRFNYWIEVHGCTGGNSTRTNAYSWAVYENTFESNYTGGSLNSWMKMRGGMGLAFNNNIKWNGSVTLRLIEDLVCNVQGCSPTCSDYSSDYPCNIQNGEQINNTYIWDNTVNGGSDEIDVKSDGCSLFIQEDRDYWDDIGDSNFVTGPAAGRNQSTCTVDDCYWASDEEKLYRCTATNKWSLVYEPYAYPHPMREKRIPKNLTFGSIVD
jgi:hypothetical protein